MIEVNKVAYVKTTDEPVFVLGIKNAGSNNDPYTPSTAAVRRPINSEEGVKHQIEEFLVVELQTAEEKLTAEMEFTKYSLEVRDRFTEERMKATAPAAEKGSYLN